jgi:hypothetical protein
MNTHAGEGQSVINNGTVNSDESTLALPEWGWPPGTIGIGIQGPLRSRSSRCRSSARTASNPLLTLAASRGRPADVKKSCSAARAESRQPGTNCRQPWIKATSSGCELDAGRSMRFSPRRCLAPPGARPSAGQAYSQTANRPFRAASRRRVPAAPELTPRANTAFFWVSSDEFDPGLLEGEQFEGEEGLVPIALGLAGAGLDLITDAIPNG